MLFAASWACPVVGQLASGYSEAHFKTMKYRPEFPERFGCIEYARAHCQTFFAWYNDQHCHSGIGHMTPRSVRFGLAVELRIIRQATLDSAFMANSHRFNKPPQLAPMPTAAWINPPSQDQSIKPHENCTLN